MANLEKATFGGGCFWCTEAVFQKIKGVHKIVSGYAGGKKDNPTYQEVSSGDSAHAEVIQIEFDPDEITYKQLLDVFWHVHDPTTLNRQGPDLGTQYRSIIFYHSKEQKRTTERSKEELENSGEFINPVTTEIKKFDRFYSAEEYHQKFFEKNPKHSYCMINIKPKIKKVKKKYAHLLK